MITDTTTDKAAQIRQTLKSQHGWNSRDVSVRADYYSLGSSIHVTIKNPAVSIQAVKAIAKRAERIDRCEITGDILGGGTRYVDIRYTDEALRALAAPYAEAVSRAGGVLDQSSDNSLIPIEGTLFMLGKGRHGYGLAIWDHTSHRAEVNDQDGVCKWVAIGSWNQ